MEQAIPNLLSYPLQDFRVHEVDPATPTSIPTGNVVIVIDVGDSEHAPHQDTFTKLYYHRVSGHSVRAPHLYLESLRLREKYPSREIVCAWRDYVINPLLSSLVSERAYLEQRMWTWESSRGRAHGLSIYYISARGSYTANQEQFLESHPEIQEAMDAHDEAAAEVLTRCEQLFQTIKESSLLLDTYLKAISSASLQELRAKYPNHMRHGETDEAILRTLFGNPDDREGHLAMFAADIMNKVGDISSTGRMSSPLWDTYREKFLEVLNYPPVSDHCARADAAREELLRRIESLIALLKTRRSDLTKRQGVPVEVTKEVQVIYREGLHYL